MLKTMMIRMLLGVLPLGMSLGLLSDRPAAANPVAPNPLEGSSQIAASVDQPSGGHLSDPMEQVTSVSQLSDVQPTDWAFQALQSLVERYGVIAGYPDGKFRGNRALTRYEFAAGLNAALDRVNELIAAGTADLVSKEDLATLQKLQEEFSAELATLRGRVDALEARTATLEAQQFSTTTKLSGNVFFNLTGVGGVSSSNPIKIEDGLGGVITKSANPSITFSNLVWLNLNTSFTGQDSLTTQLAVGNGNSPTNEFVTPGFAGNFYNTWGVPFTDQTAGAVANQVILRELSYSFPVNKNLRLVVGPRVNTYKYFDDNRFTFFLTGVGSFNGSGSTLFNTLDRGAGAVALLKLSNQFGLRVGYLAESNEFFTTNSSANPASGQGLFGGTNTLMAELNYTPSSNFNLRLLYGRSNIQGSGVSEPTTGVFADAVKNSTADTYIANFDWLVSPNFGLFGRYSYGNATPYSAITSNALGTVTTQSIQVGLAFPDLGKRGALGTLSFLIPYDVTGGRSLLSSGAAASAGLNYKAQYEIEANYFLPLSDNIAIVPNLQVIVNPNNIDGNPTVYVGNLRTQFSF